MSTPTTGYSWLQVAINGHVVDATATNKPTTNLFNFTGTPVPSSYSPDLATFVSNFAAAMATGWKACFCTDWVCDSVIARDLVHVTRPGAAYGTPTAFTGTVTAPSGSTQESAFVQLKTNFVGKSFRGGLKISPIPDANVVENHLNATQISLYQAMVAAIVSIPISDGTNLYLLGLWSRKYSTLDPVVDNVIAGQVVTTARVRKTTGTMKRRKSKGVY